MEALVVIAVLGALTWWGARQIRILRAANALVHRLRAEGALIAVSPLNSSARVVTLGERDTGWYAAAFSITSEQLTIYPRTETMSEQISFPAAELRWFGRPVKYHDGRNEIWLHFEQAGRWYVVKLRMSRYLLADVVRALKQLAAPELVTAYRRRRPYIHYGPTTVRPAEEDIHGAWTLDERVCLYVTPAQVVLMSERGWAVERVIPLERVQKVTAMRRIDQPNADGLVVFDAEAEAEAEADGEALAFAAKDYQALAQALADAARRSLEAPLRQKQKGKKYDDYDEYDDEAEADE